MSTRRSTGISSISRPASRYPKHFSDALARKLESRIWYNKKKRRMNGCCTKKNGPSLYIFRALLEYKLAKGWQGVMIKRDHGGPLNNKIDTLLQERQNERRGVRKSEKKVLKAWVIFTWSVTSLLSCWLLLAWSRAADSSAGSASDWAKRHWRTWANESIKGEKKGRKKEKPNVKKKPAFFYLV